MLWVTTSETWREHRQTEAPAQLAAEAATRTPRRRATRILDMMQRDGITGPPDGSKPREVLKPPDWLHAVEGQMR